MLSKTGINAAKAVALMAGLKPGEYLGAAAIAREIGAPENYLGKLLKILAGVGILESQKGFGGGFRLARAARKISLFDVVEPIDKVSRWDGCFMGSAKCSNVNPCAVHERWKAIRESYLSFLKETTVEDLSQKAVTEKL